MTIQEFEQELKLLDPRLGVVANPNRPQLCNIKINGVDICPIPANEIREQRDPNYCIQLPNGTMVPHKSREEALAIVKHTLNVISTPEGQADFFGAI